MACAKPQHGTVALTAIFALLFLRGAGAETLEGKDAWLGDLLASSMGGDECAEGDGGTESACALSAMQRRAYKLDGRHEHLSDHLSDDDEEDVVTGRTEAAKVLDDPILRTSSVVNESATAASAAAFTAPAGGANGSTSAYMDSGAKASNGSILSNDSATTVANDMDAIGASFVETPIAQPQGPGPLDAGMDTALRAKAAWRDFIGTNSSPSASGMSAVTNETSTGASLVETPLPVPVSEDVQETEGGRRRRRRG